MEALATHILQFRNSKQIPGAKGVCSMNDKESASLANPILCCNAAKNILLTAQRNIKRHVCLFAAAVCEIIRTAAAPAGLAFLNTARPCPH